MNRLLLLGANDFRMVFRDPMLRLFLFLPLLIVGMIGWMLPLVFDRFPVVGDYGYVILMWACMQTATMFGFINGFVFLEEKDDGVFTALRVMPVSAPMLLGFRMGLGVVMTTAVNLILLILVVVWIALIVYTFLDARRRIEDPVLVACATIASVNPCHVVCPSALRW